MRTLIHSILVFMTSVFFSLAQANDVGTVKAYLKMFPAGDFVANIKGMQGQVVMNGESYTAKNITVDVNTLKTGMEVRDGHAKDKYLEVKKFPTITLIEASGTGGKGTGKMKIKNKINTVSGTYTVDPSKRFLTAEFNIKLSDYGIEGINYRGIGVEDETKVVVVAPISAAPAAAAPAAATRTNSKTSQVKPGKAPNTKKPAPTKAPSQKKTN